MIGFLSEARRPDRRASSATLLAILMTGLVLAPSSRAEEDVLAATALDERPLSFGPAVEPGRPVASEQDAEADGEAAPILMLSDVLRATEAHFPLLRALRDEQVAREQELKAARGSFDVRLGLSGDLRPVGFYERYQGDAGVELPTQLWGARFFGGYRYGSGDYPSYDGERLTNDSGEVRAGVELPLLRGRRIDRPRADLARADIDLRTMTPEIELERISLLRSARVSFWDWLAKGRALEIAERLLEIADERQGQIEGRVAKGAQARIQLTDNRRLIVERQVALRGAERDFAQTSLRLSLFLRDPAGEPLLPDRRNLPFSFPQEIPLERDQLDQDLAHAREAHPLLRRFALERQRLEVDASLARNDLLPDLDVQIEGSRDFGGGNPGIDERGKLSPDPRGSTEVKALIRIQMPVQQRAARGRLGAATARLARLDSRAQLAREQIVTEALQAVEALEAAYDQTTQARENARLAEAMRAAEERRFALGLSNLIDVNIREVQAATAARSLIDAQASYFRAAAEYLARIGRTS